MGVNSGKLFIKGILFDILSKEYRVGNIEYDTLTRHTICQNKAHHGPVSGGGTVPMILGIESLVGTGEAKSRRDTGGGSGDRYRNGLGGAGERGDGWRDGELRQKLY